MDFSCGNEHIDRFALELLRTSWMLCGLVDNLVDALPEDAYPGEDRGSVVIEMLFGSIASGLEDVEATDLARAAELIERAGARVIEHLEVARGLSRRMHGDGRSGRNYG
jgi:hypothetical protein